MKIGILTFHWGTNYGAVMQAYALQVYLTKLGHDVSIINYKPKRYNKTLLGYFAPKRIYFLLALLKHSLSNMNILIPNLKFFFIEYINDYIKEKKLKLFRQRNLNETILYKSLSELKRNPPKFDIYICGSDQIWNSFFTTRGEGKPTSTYFLDFGQSEIKRIAYAVSFGCEVYPKDAKNIGAKHIKNFSAISVRENSGVLIVNEMGFKNPIVLPDPTLLLQSTDYNLLIEEITNTNNKSAFSYFLRGNNPDILYLEKYLKNTYKIHKPDSNFRSYSIENWIYSIKSSTLVLSNSFHCIAFSIIFHTPFIVLLSKHDSTEMNDRFFTLLRILKLDDRIINRFDVIKIKKILDETIDWNFVDIEIGKLREQSHLFFEEQLR